VPFYRNGDGKKDLKGNFKRFEYIYPELEKNKDTLAKFYFLGNMEVNADKIAMQILNIVKTDLQ